MKHLTTKRSGSRPAHRSARSGRAIGLDLGATAVRAVSLTLGSEHGLPTAALERVAGVRLPPGTVVNGAVEDPATLTAALKDLWKAHDLGGTDVILGVASPQAVVRDLRIPDMDPQQRAKALPFQAREVIALPIDEVVLDFVQLGPADDGKVDGLLVATPRKPVLAAVSAVERAGLRVAAVDLSSFAVLRSAAQGELEAEAVVDLGAHLTTIVVHHRGVPRLVRTLARGGQELTDRLADRLGVGPEEAEAAKCQLGLTGGAAGEYDDTPVALREGLRPLLGEIRSSINYFRSGNRGVSLERVCLTGGGSALPGLAEAVSQQIGVPSVVVSPVQHLGDGWWDEVSGDADGGSGAVRASAATALSVGLAMGAAA